jgi:uncharacterized protein YoxC
MDERQETLEYLTGPVGVSLEEAERIMADSDLLLNDPGSRYGYEPEEAMKMWGEAQEKLYHLSEVATEVFGIGVSVLLQDAWLRAAELRRRAEERAEDE